MNCRTLQKVVKAFELYKCGNKLIADRVEENVPIFKESIQDSEDSSKAMQSVSTPVPHALAAGENDIAVASDADSEDAGEEPLSRMQRLVRESQSPEHLLCHLPKHAQFAIEIDCTRRELKEFSVTPQRKR